MIRTYDLNGRIKEYILYRDGEKKEHAGFDEKGRKTFFVRYEGGVIKYSLTDTYTDIRKRVIKNFDTRGSLENTTVLYTAEDDHLIMRESYSADNTLLSREVKGLRHKVTDSDGRLLEVYIVKEEVTRRSEHYEYDFAGRPARITKFDKKGQTRQTIIYIYGENGSLLWWKIFGRDGRLARAKKLSYNHDGKLSHCICLSNQKKVGYYEQPVELEHFDLHFFNDEESDEDYGHEESCRKNPLTTEIRTAIPDVADALDEMQYDVDGNLSGLVPSLGYFDFKAELQYDARGNRIFFGKYIYWEDFDSKFLTLKEWEEEKYGDHGLLEESDYGETKTDYDISNYTFYEYRFDEKGRIAEKTAKKRYDKLEISSFDYDDTMGTLTKTTVKTQIGEFSGKEVKKYDNMKNLIYAETIFETGTKWVENLEIEYYQS